MKPFDHKRPFLQEFESLAEYHDFWISVTFKAPDQFHYTFTTEPIDQPQALIDSFDSLHHGFEFVRKKIKDERLTRIIEELVRMSYEFYSGGALKQGMRALQEAEGLIWPSQKIQLELASEAEMRVFGSIQTFKAVKPRQFDGEGSLASLGSGQRKLFNAAQSRAINILNDRQDFKPTTLVLDKEDNVIEIKKASYKKIKQLAAEGNILASVRTELVFLGTLIHDLEEVGCAHISARAPVKNYKLEQFRFFLDDPTIFPLQDDKA